MDHGNAGKAFLKQFRCKGVVKVGIPLRIYNSPRLVSVIVSDTSHMTVLENTVKRCSIKVEAQISLIFS